MENSNVLARAIISRSPLIVGAVASEASLAEENSACDLVELRIDSLGIGEVISHYAKRCKKPLLVTARGATEGGKLNMTLEQRRKAYFKMMPYATAIDIELRDHAKFADVIADAKTRGVIVVGSFHDFKKTPSLDELEAKLSQTADVHKFALSVNTKADLEVHRALLKIGLPLSVMGMGPLGAEARPEMMVRGSILNYGFLGETATAPNQWPVARLWNAREAK